MEKKNIDIDYLIDIVSHGGAVRTGVNVFNQSGALLIEKMVRIKNVNTLLVLKNNGLKEVPLDTGAHGGMWDRDGNPVSPAPPPPPKPAKPPEAPKPRVEPEVVKRLDEITAIRNEATTHHENARKKIKQVLGDIRRSGGEFDVSQVEESIGDIFNLITQNESAFAYVSSEIFQHQNYLQNHSVNVCTIGTAILKRFNDHFSEVVNNSIANVSMQSLHEGKSLSSTAFIYYLPEELRDISIGYFLHDVGMIMVPEDIINKKGKLNPEEIQAIRSHSFEKGMAILDKNRIDNPYVRNCVRYHHCALYGEEANSYPDGKLPIELPPYAKICKLADIYDAMTSKRAYKEASNPVGVVTELFRKYANRDHMLQFIVLSFVKILGIYPPGSIIHLRGGQMAYVLESKGPIVLPFTDTEGRTLQQQPDPVDLSDPQISDPVMMQIDRRGSLDSPIDVYDHLPEYLKKTVRNGTG